MTLDEAINQCEEVAEYKEAVCRTMENEEGEFTDSGNTYYKYCKRCAEEHRQLAEWLKKLQRYEFEISECKAILDNPTPDVTENDKKRAMFVLQTFPDVRGDER